MTLTHFERFFNTFPQDDVALPSGDELVARLKRSCKIIVDEGADTVQYNIFNICIALLN
jgi:hypothetical protein